MKAVKNIDFELCSDDPLAVAFASKMAYKRTELCTGIEVGGLTPSPGLVMACIKNEIEIHTLLRHRPGDFFYHEQDVKIFIEDMKSFKKMGVNGVVVGCLNKDGSIHEGFCRSLADHARTLGLAYSFHRAFDFVEKPFVGLELLIELGFQRILSSGFENTALEGKTNLAKLVQQARGRIEIMAGSGINAGNAQEIAQTGVDALHYTAFHATENEIMGMGGHKETDYRKIRDIPALF